jgi:hypothetical protein
MESSLGRTTGHACQLSVLNSTDSAVDHSRALRRSGLLVLHRYVAIRMPHCERAARRRELALGLRGSFGPLPQTVRHSGREAMAELARHQHDLAAVMGFMSDEVGQHMPHVER